MANRLFDSILPAEAAARRQIIEFKGVVSDFGRLSECVETDLDAVAAALRPTQWRAAPVAIRLEFAWMDEQTKVPVVTISAGVTIAAVCQRCLGVFDLDLTASLRIILVSAEADCSGYASSGEFEVWEVEDESLRPIDLVEESLVMEMPLAPMHESADNCCALVASAVMDESKLVRPFADLRSRLEKNE